MSTVNPDLAFIASMQYATAQMIFYLPNTLFFFGFVGNLLNFLVFSQKNMRSQPCVVYFLVASITNMICVVSSMTPRMLLSYFMIPDQTETVTVFCKMRLIALFTNRTISSWLLAMATVERYLISSRNVRLRRMSNLKNVYRCIIIISVLSSLIWAEAGYCFDANLVGTPQKCYAKSDVCRVLNDLSQSLTTTLFPSTVMLIFGLLTIRNIQQSQRVIHVTQTGTTTAPVRTKRDERSLTIMLAAQVILLTVFSLPLAGQKFYLTYTFYQPKSSTQRALENFVFALVLQLLNIPSCIPFYLYTITGRVFREELLKILKNGIMRLKCW